MTDFWIAVLLTSVVSLLTVLADWLASKLIFSGRTIRSLQRIINSGLAPRDARNRIADELDRHRNSQAGSLSWGANLATVAVSLDFAALGIWIHDSALFPFFSRFNDPNVAREIPVWLIVIGIHLVLLIASLALKHKHAETVGAVQPGDWAIFPSGQWLVQNAWLLTGNFVGFISLLSTFVAVTNSI